jgi:6-pyruvoyltetrahydropterin/6-carboxytetrahydropterin synthase
MTYDTVENPRKSDIEIWANFSFEAAHSLPLGIAKNERLHGHSFRGRVTISGNPSPTFAGTVWPGELLHALVTKIIGPLDHVLLNEIEDLSPTNEGLAEWIGKRVKVAIPRQCQVVSVEIWRDTCGIGARWKA